MSYIGVQKSNHLSPSFVKENFTGTGSAATFTLTNPVPGGNPDNIMVVVNNVIQEPVAAYTIGYSGNSPVVLTFTSTPANGDSIYVIHRGIGTLSRVPTAGSVGSTELSDGLKSFTIDTFSGNNTLFEFALSKTPPSASAILVFVDGIYQKLTTNYTLSGNTLSFGSGNQPATGTEIEVIHLGILTGSQRAADNSVETAMLQDDAVTTAKIANNAITIDQMGDDSVGTNELVPNSVGITQLNLSDGTLGQAITTNGSGTISFSTVGVSGISSSANATAMVIDANEKIMINTTGAVTSAVASINDGDGVLGTGSQLQLHGTSPVLDIFSYSTTDSTHGGINFMKSANDTVGSNSVVSASDIVGSIQFGGYDGNDYANIAGKIDFQMGAAVGADDTAGEIVFYTTPDNQGSSGSTERMRITHTGDTQIKTGNLVMSTAGKGIDFSAAANSAGGSTSAILDDYEEGTWSATAVGLNAAGSSSTFSQMQYIKVGRQVTVWGRLAVTAGGDPSEVHIEGWPFTLSNSTVINATDDLVNQSREGRLDTDGDGHFSMSYTTMNGRTLAFCVTYYTT